ncbi:unnamed protein product, partial [Polarella glacialis]
MATLPAAALTPSPSAGSTMSGSQAQRSQGPDCASGPQRPRAVKKWSEVCERVQQPDGSVRTSPPFQSAATSAAISSPRMRHPGGGKSFGSLRRPSHGRGGLALSGGGSTPVKAPSRGGSSRGGSSGKSSRSSSRDMARDGDISSRCSSGCWETSTNSSAPSRPRTPTDVAPPSLVESKGLLMPDPIRTGLIIPPALLADEHSHSSERVPAAGAEEEVSAEAPAPTCEATAPQSVAGEGRPGQPLKWDPFGRDGSRRPEVKSEWSPEPLAKYLKGIVVQIDTNLTDGRLPTSERLDAFVGRLVANSQRQLKHSPREVRHVLQAMFALRFQRFWNFNRNQKVRSFAAEELKWTLTGLVENLMNSDFMTNKSELTKQLAQPKPLRYYSCSQ